MKNGRFIKIEGAYAWNPLHSSKYRNLPCPCQSGKKAKKCCGAPTFALLPVKAARQFSAYLEYRDAHVAGEDEKAAKLLAEYNRKFNPPPLTDGA